MGRWPQIAGGGFFLPAGWVYSPDVRYRSDPPAGSISRLAQRFEDAYGKGAVAARIAETLDWLVAAQVPEYDKDSSADLAADRFSPAGYSFAERYLDQLSALAALHVLAAGLAVRAGMLLQPAGPEWRLSEREVQGLTDYRGQLEDQLLRLFRSTRPDWGFPLLIGMARLVALDASIASRRLAVLNVVSEPHGGEESRELQGNRLHQAFDRSKVRFQSARSSLMGQRGLDEWSYARLEYSANLFFRLGDVLSNGQALPPNETSGLSLGLLSVRPVAIAMTAAELQSRLDGLERARRSVERRLAELYGYRLLARNCVTEIFSVIDQAMVAAAQPMSAGGADELARRESRRRLGGYVGARSLDVVPFISYDTVGSRWRIVASRTFPSYRHRQMGQRKTVETAWLVDLRESNVLSSDFYGWHDGDSLFVFFTEDLLWARPLAGAFNLAAGLTQGVWGLFTMPWDEGHHLWQGAKGAVMSVPELFFFNIRKGSFPDLPLPDD